MPRHRREKGIALLMVTLLVFVMVILVMELVHSSQVQSISSEFLKIQHLSTYIEESALIKVEEILYQDVEPPPRKQDLILEEDEALVDQRSKNSDSYHDYWGAEPLVEKTGEFWLQTTIGDSEGKFNINSLIHPKTGQPLPLQMELFEKLLKNLGVRSVDLPDVMAEIVDHIDTDTKGKFEKNAKNAPLGLLRELLALKNIPRSLYNGHRYPSGELSDADLGEEDFFADDVDTSSDDISEDDAPADVSPFKTQAFPQLEEWKELGIRPGLKDVLTVYGSGSINLNTAPLALLEVIFDSRETAIEIIKARKKAPFNAMDQVMQITGANAGKKYEALLGFTSEYFDVTLRIQRGNASLAKHAVMRRSGSSVFTLFKAPLI